MKSNVIKVIAGVVDTQQLTLYKDDGTTVAIPQGDPRLARIVNEITPILSAGPGSVAEVDLEDGKDLSNPYKEIEELIGVKFFRVLKSLATKLIHDLTSEPVVPKKAAFVQPQGIGTLVVEDRVSAKVQTTAQKLKQATDEIIAHAKPAIDPNFHDRELAESGDTIVAVVGDQVIADIENLKPQFTRAVATNSPKGVQAFMTRIAAVAKDRNHSIEDLMKFMHKGDLPIADDGSIVIYKVLRRSREHEGKYLDCHTGKVLQQVGSYVCMDPSLVDHNRHTECSNGLHVACRSYIGGFPGDVCVLAKVKPEDVIAVPEYDASKMRVCGYHILFELSPEDYGKLVRNEPFTDNVSAQVLLGRVLAGDHPAPHEEVRITKNDGKGVIITPILKGHKVELIDGPKEDVKPATTLVEDETKAKLVAPALDPKSVIKDVTKAKAEVESRSAKAQRMLAEFVKTKGKAARQIAAQTLLDHKKATKLGWVALGISEKDVKLLQDAIA